MISPFLQKLDFVHQFRMGDGNIGVLGVDQIMLPSALLSELSKKEDVYGPVKKCTLEEITLYMRKISHGEAEKVRIVEHVFETFGLGKLKIDAHKADVSGSPLSDGRNPLTRGAVAGVFCYLLSKDVDAHFKPSKGGSFVYEIK
ncbi:hypothetical protein HY638_04485 [Candidatus Woesearchaeota archaeon]|nr:hypothetical protein [Candidatus Woesearchaeota archaeon]